jgi:hypothetical protein
MFADHMIAAYVGKIREVRFLAFMLPLLRAVSGMVPHGQSDANPASQYHSGARRRKTWGSWRIALYQNTPAQFHGRPDLSEALTEELRELL